VTRTGRANFNAQCFLAVYADAQRNALRAVVARPGVYLRDRAAPFARHFSLPPIEAQAPGMDHFGHNVVLRDLATVYQYAMLRVPLTIHLPDATVSLLGGDVFTVAVSLVLFFATLLVACRAGISTARLGRRKRDPTDIAWVFVGLTVVYATVVSIATEYGENQRFRVMVDPIVLGVFVAQLVALGTRMYDRRNLMRSSTTTIPASDC
jgi:hypothetical protein